MPQPQTVIACVLREDRGADNPTGYLVAADPERHRARVAVRNPRGQWVTPWVSLRHLGEFRLTTLAEIGERGDVPKEVVPAEVVSLVTGEWTQEVVDDLTRLASLPEPLGTHPGDPPPMVPSPNADPAAVTVVPL